MKRGSKTERDKALWLNDEQESLLEEHKRRIKRRKDHRRAEQERWREDKQRAEQERRQEDHRRAEQERRRQEQRREGERQEEQQRERERWKDQQRAVEIVDALSGLGEQRRRRYWTQRPAEQEITGLYEPAPNPLRQEEQLEERKRREDQQRAEQERRRQEQLEERKRREDQQREWHRFSDLSEKIMNPRVSACFSLPELDEDDIRLVEKWYLSQEKLDGRSLIDVINDDPKDGDSGRLLSARSAEKIATDFYQSYGKAVEDISITQIDESNNPDSYWRDYDLNVDGCHIDVKNSRRSQKSEDRYTEYCIPRFKTERRTNQEVRIAGVFSPYLWAFELLDEPVEHHQDREIQFLGETTLEKQEALKREFNGDLVYFSEPRPLSKYFLPPWIFEREIQFLGEQEALKREFNGDLVYFSEPRFRALSQIYLHGTR